MAHAIQIWKEDDILYVKTRATKHVLECVEQYSCVSVIGPSGSGKTALAQHVALELTEKEYTIIKVTFAKDIRKFYESDRKTLYFVDDICGNFTAIKSRIEKWKKSMDDIKIILKNVHCKLLVTCRLQVFQDKGFRNLDIFKECVCNLMSKDLALTFSEKEKMTEKYFGEHSSEVLTNLGEYEFLPLLCKLYFKEKKNPQFILETFLKDPFSFYKKQLTEMFYDCEDGKYKYCALLLLVIFNNRIEVKHISGKEHQEIIEDIRKACKMHRIEVEKLECQLETLIGTFVIHNEIFYKTIHDKLFDFLAHYFGTKTDLIEILIKHVNASFVQERFILTGDNIADLSKSTNYLIPVPDDKLELYIKRIFDGMTTSKENRHNRRVLHFENVNFRSRLLQYMKRLNKKDIAELIKTGSGNFVNEIFVMTEDDIEKHVKYWYEKYQCYGIVIPDDMLQQYFDRWFDHLTKTNEVKNFMNYSRPLMNLRFRDTLRTYIRQLNTVKLISLIETCSRDFFNTMFVMTNDVIQLNNKNQYKCFGIVLYDGLVQKYTETQFHYCTLLNYPCTFLNSSRILKSSAYGNALQNYMRQLSIEQIASFIHKGNENFIKEMFVMTEDDLKYNNKNCYERVGIVIPDVLLQNYIERLFDHLLKAYRVEAFMDECRPLMNDAFRIELRNYLNQLNAEQIGFFIDTGSLSFFNTMFVNSDVDINECDQNISKRFGIIIPGNLVKQYFQKWFEYLLDPTTNVSGFIYLCRPLSNYAFRTALHTYMNSFTKEQITFVIQNGSTDCLNTMFVMTKDDIRHDTKNRYDCFGFVLSGDLLQQYIERWFDKLTNHYTIDEFINTCRPLMNFAFKTALRSYIGKLNTESIDTLIQNGSKEFFNKMFVTSENDCKDDTNNIYECIGIVIPDDLLHQYIGRWFEELKKEENFQTFLYESRPLRNVTFRNALHTYTTQINRDKVLDLIKMGNKNVFNKIFVMTKDDIKEDICKWQYLTHTPSDFGIVIPDEFLQQYIEKWLNYFTQSCSIYNESRPCTNGRFVNALRNYMKRLSSDKIASIIKSANEDFIYNAFVMKDKDINENSMNIYEKFGIIIPTDLLQMYIERWFYHFKEGSYINKNAGKCRLLSDVTFRTALLIYINEINTDTVASLIQKGNKDFFYSAFVMAEVDIKEDAEYVYELFGIIIPKELLPSYIERWFYHFITGDYKEKLTAECRLWANVEFRTSLLLYTKQLNTEKVASLIQNESSHFINTMFVMTEKDIKINAKYTYECFGIIISTATLHQYIEKWFFHLTKTDQLETFINNCRPLMNEKFRTALRTYIRNFNKEQIAGIIQTTNHNFFNIMFVKSKDDIKDSAKRRYESFGIVIPDDLLQQCMERLLDHMAESYCSINDCRSLMNISFRITFHNFLRELNREKIADLIHTGNRDFISRMLVMSDDSISDTGENCYKCFGIVVPDDLKHFYIEKLLNNYHASFGDANWIYGARHMMNFRFRTAVRVNLGQMTSHKITNILWSVGDTFFDILHSMTIDDMNANDEITDDMLIYHNLMTERMLGRLIKADNVEEFIDKNGDLRRHKFDLDCWYSNDIICNTILTGLPTYLSKLSTTQISCFIKTGSKDFLDRMFVIKNDEIKDSSRYECFGIVLPNNLIQQYIERWFNGLTEADSVRYYMSNNRPLKNITFRSAVRTYMRELNTEQITALIQDGNDDFLNKMFVMTDASIVDNLDNLCECFGIVVPVESVQHYVEKLFHRLVNTNRVKEFLKEGRHLMNNTFLTAMCSYVQQLNQCDIVCLIKNGTSDFLNTMFVMTEDDIKNNGANRYECFGIIIPDDMLQLFVQRLFDFFTKSKRVTEFMNSSRLLMNVDFRTTMCSYMRQLNNDSIFSLMQTVNGDFFSKMFVITEEDIESNAMKLYECIGIVIPGDLLQYYIKRWFHHLIQTDQVQKFMQNSRTFINITFRTALRTYMRQLSTLKMDYLIQTVSEIFFENFFEMSKNDSNDSDENPYDILPYYIERWFERLTKDKSPKDFMNKSSHLKNDTIRIALHSYIEQLSTEKIASLIQTENNYFFNSMFVMSDDDIKDDAKSRYECFDIVIPSSLLQQYIESWFERITKQYWLQTFINESRLLRNDKFRAILYTYMKTLTTEKIASLIDTGNNNFFDTMFVVTDDEIKEHSENLYECVGIVIPDNLLQKYLERWFQCLTKKTEIQEFMNESKPLMNDTFRTALRSYMRHLSKEKIASIIKNGNMDFINKMFVVSENDIKENSNNRYECFGIVIPDGLLHQYLEWWLDVMHKYTRYMIMELTNSNRPLKNVVFRVALRSYLKQISTDKISSFIQDRNSGFLNSMFVMTENDIKDNDENMSESFGIIIPDDLLQQYIEWWFKQLTKTDKPKKFMNNSRPLKNITYITALRTFMKQLNTCKIASLIQNIHEKSFNTMSESRFDHYEVERMHNRNDEFLNTMFVMTEDDLKDKGDFLYERVGIVIPSDLVQYYLEIWFEHLTKTSRMEEFMNESRPLINTTFRTALQIYMTQLKTKQVDSLIKKVSNDFFNKMFAMTEDDINDNDTNRCECFGIIIPCDLLQVYIKRWFVVLTESYSRNDILNSSRPWKSVLFRNGVRNYMRHMNTDEMEELIKNDGEFCKKIFVMIADDFNDNAHSPDDMLQYCIEKWFSHLSRSSKVDKIMEDTTPFMHVIFRTTLRIYMERLKTEQIDYVIRTGSSCFVNTMFVMKEYEIQENSESQYECFGIVLPGELIQKYIEKWFDHLTKSDKVKTFINENRPLMHIRFKTALSIYMKQLTTERTADLIKTGSNCFINTMFVMTETDIKDKAENQHECLGIVLPEDLLLQYIVKWFPRKNTTTRLKEYLNDNRLLMNDTFRTALRTFMNDSKTELIASLVQNPSIDILNIIFVMTEDDIKDNAENRYECFGLVVADNMLQEYIYKWVECLKNVYSVVDYMKANRPLLNATFQTALRTYFKQLPNEEISALMKTGSRDFLNTMFVMTREDINVKTDNQYECIGIVIPSDLLLGYIKKWIEFISNKYRYMYRTKFYSMQMEIEANRPMKNAAFRTALCTYIKRLSTKSITTMLTEGNCHFRNEFFVMSDDNFRDITQNRYECISIVIPCCLLRRYIEQWFKDLSETDSIREFMDINKPLMNVRFQTQLRTYISQLNGKAIENLIKTASTDFVNLMFVMTEDDIKDNAKNRYEWFGIIIPDGLLQQYIGRWFGDLTRTDSVKKCIDANRCVNNETFRKILQTYIRQINEGTIIALIQTGSRDFVNTMFVKTENDIKDNAAVNQYECFGIVIPDGLLHQYIEKRFNSWKKNESAKACINKCRFLMNFIGRKAMQNYIRQINENTIGIIIHTGSRNFINTMFVMADDDIKDAAVNRYECLGVVLSDGLLQQFIGRLFDGLTKADSVETCIDANRCFLHRRFRKALETYTKQLTRGKIGNLIRTGSRDFVNTMFVMTECDIKDDTGKRNECFGIILPDDLLYQYIERWFDGMTKTDSAKQYINASRMFTYSKFQITLDSFINGINSFRMEFLNRKRHIDYLNTRRDLIKETSEIKN